MSNNFFQSLVEIAKHTPYTYGSKKEVRCILYENKAYKIRVCDSLEKAEVIAENVGLPSEKRICPKFYAIHENALIFDWIANSRNLELSEHTNSIHSLGNLIAQVHVLPLTRPILNEVAVTSGFFDDCEFLSTSGVINPKESRTLIMAYSKLKPSIVPIRSEYNNLSHHNTILAENGQVYLSDEEAFSSDVLFSPLVKAFLYWFSPEQKEDFWHGYIEEGGNNSVFKEHQQFIELYTYTRWVAKRTKKNLEISTQLKDSLERIIKSHKSA